MSCKWAKGTGGPAGDEYQNLVAAETVGTLCSDTHPGAYSGQDAYTGRLVPQFFDEQASGSQYGTSGVASTCSTRDYKDATDLVVTATGPVTHALTVSDSATEDDMGRGTPIVPAIAFNVAPGKGVRKDDIHVTDGSITKTLDSRGGDPTMHQGGTCIVQPATIAFHPTQDPISSTDGTIHSRGCGSSGGTATGAVAIPFDTTQITSPLNRSSPRAGDTGHPLAAQAHAPAVALEGAQRTVAGTLSARTQGGGGLGTDCELDGGLQPVGAMAVRRLTPTETARLQGFPDDWNSEGIDTQGRRIVMADSSRYKQMGNAVTVNVAQAIAERVAMVLERAS